MYPIAGAVAVHLLALVLAGRLVPARLPPLPQEDVVTVEIVAQAPPPARPSVSASLPAPALPEPSAPPAQTDADGLVQSSRTYSAQVLADPRSRKARQALPLLAADERLIQLCNIEAMEQVRLATTGLTPEAVVAYAMAEMEMGGYTLYARGGAFRAGQRWYNIAYRCTARPDYGGVISFAFKVGEEVPQTEWASHHLAPDIAHPD